MICFRGTLPHSLLRPSCTRVSLRLIFFCSLSNCTPFGCSAPPGALDRPLTPTPDLFQGSVRYVARKNQGTAKSYSQKFRNPKNGHVTLMKPTLGLKSAYRTLSAAHEFTVILATSRCTHRPKAFRHLADAPDSNESGAVRSSWKSLLSSEGRAA